MTTLLPGSTTTQIHTPELFQRAREPEIGYVHCLPKEGKYAKGLKIGKINMG